MPTPGQYQLFEQLRRDFGEGIRWKHLTAGQDFDAMRTHRAGHFLAGLVSAFTGRRTFFTCDCTRPGERYYAAFRPFPKTPSAGTQGASDGQGV